MTSRRSIDPTKRWFDDVRMVTHNLGVLFEDLDALCYSAPDDTSGAWLGELMLVGI